MFTLQKRQRPVVQRTNGVVVPPAGSASGAAPLIAAAWSGVLVGALSGASRTARERPSAPGLPRGSHRPALAWRPPGPTPLGHRREAATLPRGNPAPARGEDRTGGAGAYAKMSERGARRAEHGGAVDRALVERAQGGDRDAYGEVASLSSHR